MSESIATLTKPEVKTAIVSPESQEFELMQRQAKLFASSPLVPAHIRGNNVNEGLANCYIALVLAKQMGENPLVVMQNIYIVHGRAGWSASYMIAKANASGVFRGVIRFKHSGEGAKRTCTASATLADTGETVDCTVSMEMAAAEGWTKNSKYKTMPDQMLIYRAATFLVRTYCPQVLLGLRTDVEVETMPELVEADVEPASVIERLRERSAEPVEGEIIEGDPLDLEAAIAAFEAAGGIFDEFAENNKISPKAIKASRGDARASWAKLIAGETELLKGAAR